MGDGDGACTPGKRVGRWSVAEHQLFVQGMMDYPKQWKKIAQLVKTRTVVQIRTHAQKCWNTNAGSTACDSPIKQKENVESSRPTTSPIPKTVTRKRKGGESSVDADTKQFSHCPVTSSSTSSNPSFCRIQSSAGLSLQMPFADSKYQTVINTSPTSVADDSLFGFPASSTPKKLLCIPNVIDGKLELESTSKMGDIGCSISLNNSPQAYIGATILTHGAGTREMDPAVFSKSEPNVPFDNFDIDNELLIPDLNVISSPILSNKQSMW